MEQWYSITNCSHCDAKYHFQYRNPILRRKFAVLAQRKKGRKAQKNPFFLIIFEILSRKDTNNNRALFVVETETVEKYSLLVRYQE